MLLDLKRKLIFAAIESNTTRAKIQDKLIEQGLNIVSLIHPSPVIGT